MWYDILKLWNWLLSYGILVFYMHRRNNVAAELALLKREVNKMSKNILLFGVTAIFIIFTAAMSTFAQSNITLYTQEQAYNNLAKDASFESWSVGTTGVNAVPDGWTKTGAPTSYDKITADKRLGSASLQITVNTANQGISQIVTVEPNTTYTIGFYYKVSAGSSKFTVTGTISPALTGNTGFTGANWAYKSFTFTTGSATTAITLNFLSEGTSDVFLLDGVMITRGSLAPAFIEKVITDTGDHTMYGGLTVYGTADLKGNVNLGDLSSDNITLTGTLKSPDAANVTITPGSGGKTTITGDVDVSSNLDVDGTITAGSGNNQITTAAGLLDATKLTDTISTDRYSSYSDLVAEAKVGSGDTIVTSSNYSNYGDIRTVTAGTGLSGGGTIGDVTLNIANAGVTETQLNTSVAGAGLVGGGGTALAVGAGTGISVTANAVGIAAGGVGTTQLATGAVTRPKFDELRPGVSSTVTKIRVEQGYAIVQGNTPLLVQAQDTSFTFPGTGTAGWSRIDLVAIDSLGAVVRAAGTAALTPSAPDYPSDELVIAEVTIDEVENAAVSIAAGDISDVRPFLSLGGGSGMSAITGTTSESFTIGDSADGNKTLAFEEGETDQTLTWNDSSSRFDLTSSLNIPTGSNFMINGSQVSSGNLSDVTTIAMLDEAETVTGGWTFNTANTTFTTAIDVNSESTMAGLNIDTSGVLKVAGTTAIDASRNLTNIGTISSAGNFTLDGDLNFTGPQSITTTTNNLVLNPANTIDASNKGIIQTGALAGVTNIDSSGKATFTDTSTLNGAQVIDVNSTGILAGTAGKTIASISDNAVHTTTGAITGLEVAMSGTYTTATLKGIDVQMASTSQTAINTNAKINANNVTATTLTDGTASITGGNVTGVGSLTATSLNSGTGAFTGDVTVGGGYASGGITIGSDGTLSIGEDIVQSNGKKYMSDATTFTGDYSVALSTNLGVGPGASADETYLQISDTGIISAPGATTTAVTIADALTQTGSTNQVTFQGNVDASNGLDVTGAALTGAAGLTISAGNVALSTSGTVNQSGSGQVTFGGNVDATNGLDVTGADFTIGTNKFTVANASGNTVVAGTLGVTGATTLTGALQANGGVILGDSGDTVAIDSSDWDITTEGNMTDIGSITMDGNLTASSSLLDIDKSYTNPTGAINDHAITRNITLDDATAKTVSGNVLAITSVNTQTSGTLTDNSTLLNLTTGANVGSTGYFIYAENSAGSAKFRVDKDGNLWTAGTQIVSGGTTYDGQMLLDYTDPEAVLIRKDSDGGDVFIVNTTSGLVGINKTPTAGVELDVSGDGIFSGTLQVNNTAAGALDVAGGINAGTSNAFQVATTGGITAASLNAGSGLVTTSGNIQTTGSGTITAANGLSVSAGGGSVAGGLGVTGANLTLDTNDFIVNTNKFTVDGATGNTTIAGIVTQLRTIYLVPEYENSLVMPDGSNNRGTLKSTYSGGHSYYEWTTNEPVTQDYDIVVRVKLPDGFTTFDAEPIELYNKVSNATGTTKVSVALYDTSNAVVTIAATGGAFNTPWLDLSKSTDWQNTTITKTGGTFAAGGYVTIIIKLSADQNETVDAGELSLKGNW